MPKLTFLPLGVTVEAKKGDTILDTAIDHDVPLHHACGGFCSCTTCEVIVQSGEENLSKIEDDETERLHSVGKLEPHHRLGCQAKVMGNVTVQMANLD